MGREEALDLIEWDGAGFGTIEEIRCGWRGENNELLVLALQLCERIFAHIARVCLSAVHDHDGAFGLVGELQNIGVQPRKARGGIPAIGGVARALVETAGSFVVRVVIQQELWSVGWRLVGNAAGTLS